MVHAGVRSIGPVLGGVNTILSALLDACSPGGTLVAYVDWELGYEDPVAAGLENDVPVFDKRIAKAARDNGILSEVIRTWPGAIRSDNPDAGIAAIGERAEWLCAGHALSYGYGEGSPFAKLVEVGAKILMLGAPLDTATLLHYSEHMANIGGKRIKNYCRRLSLNGVTQWVDVEEFDTSEPVIDGMPEDHFAKIAEAALSAGCGRKGRVGAAHSYLFDARGLHEAGVKWLESWKTG